MSGAGGYAIHEVLNQVPPLEEYDAFATDPALARILEVWGGGWAEERLHATGRAAASAEVRFSEARPVQFHRVGILRQRSR